MFSIPMLDQIVGTVTNGVTIGTRILILSLVSFLLFRFHFFSLLFMCF
eukprot:00364.XXX_1819_1962_1 [CDS] Oithona nana genome sequencing.